MLDTLARRDHADVVAAAAVLRDGASTGEDDLEVWVGQNLARYATGKILEADLVVSSGGTSESDVAR